MCNDLPPRPRRGRRRRRRKRKSCLSSRKKKTKSSAPLVRRHSMRRCCSAKQGFIVVSKQSYTCRPTGCADTASPGTESRNQEERRAGGQVGTYPERA